MWKQSEEVGAGWEGALSEEQLPGGRWGLDLMLMIIGA